MKIKSKKRRLTNLVLWGAMMAVTHNSAAQSPTTISSWVVYWDDKSTAALTAMAPSLQEVCLFAYHFADDGRLLAAGPRVAALETIYASLGGSTKPRWLITIVNDRVTPSGVTLKDPAIVHKVLATPSARKRHIAELVKLSERADGIEIDYERVAAADGKAFSIFVRDLAAALHRKKKWLSVVLQPRTSDQTTPDMLRTGTGTLDWVAVAAAADQVKVMAYLYRYSGSEPGSIAPIDWVEQIGRYGLQKMSADKLSIALHLGGIDWPEGAPGKSIEYPQASALAAAHQTEILHDAASESASFQYLQGAVQHEVWIEDAAGVQKKIERLQNAGVRHIALWRMATGDPALWSWLQQSPVPAPQSR